MNFFAQFTHQTNNSFACCNCRTTTTKTNRVSQATCSHCGHTMHNMGAGFVAPRQSDNIEWKKVALLVKHNFTFEYLSA